MITVSVLSQTIWFSCDVAQGKSPFTPQATLSDRTSSQLIATVRTLEIASL